MSKSQPITTAVYGGRAADNRPRRTPPPHPGTLLGELLGEEKVAAIYRQLGFKRPEQRRRRRRSQ